MAAMRSAWARLCSHGRGSSRSSAAAPMGCRGWMEMRQVLWPAVPRTLPLDLPCVDDDEDVATPILSPFFLP
ncbi:hypothetical protein ACP70R_030988 [Stipagrostis hirtigluma subsp. patula]